jgi:hypothetical protein
MRKSKKILQKKIKHLKNVRIPMKQNVLRDLLNITKLLKKLKKNRKNLDTC